MHYSLGLSNIHCRSKRTINASLKNAENTNDFDMWSLLKCNREWMIFSFAKCVHCKKWWWWQRAKRTERVPSTFSTGFNWNKTWSCYNIWTGQFAWRKINCSELNTIRRSILSLSISMNLNKSSWTQDKFSESSRNFYAKKSFHTVSIMKLPHKLLCLWCLVDFIFC